MTSTPASIARRIGTAARRLTLTLTATAAGTEVAANGTVAGTLPADRTEGLNGQGAQMVDALVAAYGNAGRCLTTTAWTNGDTRTTITFTA